MSDVNKPKGPEGTGGHAEVVRSPGVLDVVYRERAQTAEEISAAASPREFGHMPGAEVLSGSGINPGGFNKLKEGWRVLYARIPHGSFKSVQELLDIVASFGGEVLKFPFGAESEMELLMVFPNNQQASGAKLGFEGFEGAECGMQKTEELYGGFINGVPCFAGKGVDEAVGLERGDEGTPAQQQFVTIQSRYTHVPDQRLLHKLSEIPRNLSTVCAVAEIRMGDYMTSMEPQRRKALMDAIFGILNNRTDVFEWIGNKLRIVSTREQAITVLSVEFKKILRAFEDANLQIVIAEGNLVVMNLGKGRRTPPRTLKSGVFAGVGELLTPKKKGVFVNDDGLAQLQSPRGAVVRKFTKHPEGAVELEDISYRSSEVMTGGPQKMIGRDDLMAGVHRNITGIKRTGRTQLHVLDGGPGIGKSRLIEETIGALRERGIDNITYTKAYEHEAARTYSFVRKFGLELLKNNKNQWHMAEYKLLYFFVTGKEAPEELRAQIESLYMQPSRLARTIRAVMVGSFNVFAGFMDDLQWCDVRSAAVIAELIRSLDDADKVMLEFSARSGTQEMPLAIRQALSEKGVTATHLEALKFVDAKGAPTDILKEYVWESLKRTDPDVKPIFPQQFMTELGRVSGGVPFAVTQILLDLQRKGTLRVNAEHEPEVVGEVDFTDYTGMNLYENVIARLTADEQKVYEVLVLFDGGLDMSLFRILFPSLEHHAHALARQEMVAPGETLKISHDLLLEAAKKKFPKDAGLAWRIYGQVQALAGNPVYSQIITHQMRYGLISPTLGQMDEVSNMQLRGNIYDAALGHGISAVQELETQHRAPEAKAILSELLKKVGPRNMTAEQRYHCGWRLANVSFRMGEAATLIESLRTCEKILEQRADLDANGMRRLDLHFLQGDAAHMIFDAAGTETSIRKLKAHGSGINKRGLSPTEITRVDTLRYVEDLWHSRAAYHREEYQEAARLCKKVIWDLEQMGRSMSAALPLEHEKILVEARRFYGIVIGREEEVSRQKIDADVMYMIPAGRDRVAVLKEGVAFLKSAVADMRSDRPVMISPKHLAGALSMLARLMAFSGESLGEAERVIDETIREAANYKEIKLLSALHKLKADLLMSRPGSRTARTIIEKAIETYGRGRAEMMQLSEGRTGVLYAYNACNEARAHAILVESFEAGALKQPGVRPDQIEEKVGRENRGEIITSVQNGLYRAAEALGPMMAQSREEVRQYLFPTIGRLFRAVARYNLIREITIPEEIRGIAAREVSEAGDYISGISGQIVGDPHSQVVSDEIGWKSAGLQTLDTVVSAPAWARH